MRKTSGRSLLFKQTQIEIGSCTMTHVRLSPLILGYRQMIQQQVNEARDEKLRISALAETASEYFPIRMDMPAPAKAGLLPPPKIHILSADIYLRNGMTEGFIQ